MPGIDPSVLEEIRREHRGAPHGSKVAVIERWASALRVDPDTVWNRLKKGNARTRQRRNDAGQTSIPESVIKAIAGFKLRARQFGGRGLTTEDAYGQAVDAGLAPRGLSLSNIDRVTREMGLSKRRPFARFQAEDPNERHQVDFSGSEYLIPVKVDGEWFAEVRAQGEEYKNRPRKERMRFWVVSLVDDYSRFMRAAYVLSPGESAVALVQFLQAAWRRRPGSEFCGIPEIIQTDNGPSFKSEAFRTMVSMIPGMKHDPSKRPGHKERQGKVESSFRQIWRRFELLFISGGLVGERIPLEYLQSSFEEWQDEWNRRRPRFSRPKARPMSGGKLKRSGRSQRIFCLSPTVRRAGRWGPTGRCRSRETSIAFLLS